MKKTNTLSPSISASFSASIYKYINIYIYIGVCVCVYNATLYLYIYIYISNVIKGTIITTVKLISFWKMERNHAPGSSPFSCSASSRPQTSDSNIQFLYYSFDSGGCATRAWYGKSRQIHSRNNFANRMINKSRSAGVQLLMTSRGDAQSDRTWTGWIHSDLSSISFFQTQIK